MADERRDGTERARSSRGSRSFIEFARLLASDGDFSRSERIAVLSRLIPDQNRALVTRFFLMLTLSVTIAVMGLVANSVAVVIGAMLIAPLMTPIMSFAAAVGLGLARRTVQAAVLVLTGSHISNRSTGEAQLGLVSGEINSSRFIHELGRISSYGVCLAPKVIHSSLKLGILNLCENTLPVFYEINRDFGNKI